MTETIRAGQGSQPSYAGVRVGIVAVGDDHGVPTARLLIRSDADSRRLDLARGDSADLFGRATLTLDEVTPGPGGRGTVTLTFSDADA